MGGGIPKQYCFLLCVRGVCVCLPLVVMVILGVTSRSTGGLNGYPTVTHTPQLRSRSSAGRVVHTHTAISTHTHPARERELPSYYSSERWKQHTHSGKHTLMHMHSHKHTLASCHSSTIQSKELTPAQAKKHNCSHTHRWKAVFSPLGRHTHTYIYTL
jgi:hypothetical protein